MFRKLCGESTLKNTIIVTNMWKDGSQDINEARERELSTKLFKLALDGGARMVRHQNTAESAHNIIRRFMENNPAPLRIQRELVIERKDIVNTTVGKVISREFNEQIRRHWTELKEVRDEMERALKWKDEEMRRKLAEEARRLQERIAQIARDEEGISADYVAEKARIEAGRGARKILQDRANHAHSLRNEANAADRARSKQQTKGPQDLTSAQTTILLDKPASNEVSPRTAETGSSSLPQQSARLLPPSTSNHQIASHVTSYA